MRALNFNAQRFSQNLLSKVKAAMGESQSTTPKVFNSNPSLDRCYRSMKAGYDVGRRNPDGSLLKGIEK